MVGMVADVLAFPCINTLCSECEDILAPEPDQSHNLSTRDNEQVGKFQLEPGETNGIPQLAMGSSPQVPSDLPSEPTIRAPIDFQFLVDHIKKLQVEVIELRARQGNPTPAFHQSVDPVLERFLAAQRLAQEAPSPSAMSDVASTIVPPPYALTDIGAPSIESDGDEESTTMFLRRLPAGMPCGFFWCNRRRLCRV